MRLSSSLLSQDFLPETGRFAPCIRNLAPLKAVILACTCFSTPGFAQDAGDHAASAPASGVQEIVVTAQKRQQRLQDVPIAVTALNPQALAAARFAGVEDLNGLAPGLTARSSPGGVEVPTLTMRGVYGATSFGADSGIALYIDGVYVNDDVGANFDVADLDHVEVLRGPQGTLFGRNALGGAVNLITRDPPGKFGLRQEISYGSLGTFRSKTRLDLPQIGPLSLSATYLRDQAGGDVRNLGAGTVFDFGPATGGAIGREVSPARLGGHTIDAFAATAKLSLDHGINIIYKFNHTHNDYIADAVGVVGISPYTATGFLPVSLQNIYASNNPALMTPISGQRPDAVNGAFNLPSYLAADSHILTLSMPVTDHISIKDIASLRLSRVLGFSQVDGLGGLIYNGPTFPGYGGTITSGQPLLGIVNVTANHEKTWSNEFQVNVKTHLFDLTAGLLYFKSLTVQGAVPGITNTSYMASAVNYVIPATPGTVPSNIDVISKAAYAQLEGHVMPGLDVVLGMRVTQDTKTGTDNAPTPILSIPINYDKTTPTWLAGVNYHINSNILTYAKFSTAYISGGELDGIVFHQSSARSWEAGIKSDLFDRMLRFNLALYSANYQAVQVVISPTNPACQALGASIYGAICIINGGNALARGFELETTLMPARGLSFNVNLGYTDYKVENVLPALRDAVNGNYTGSYRPKWTAEFSAGYDSREIVDGAHATARLDATFSSSQYPFPNGSNADYALSMIPATWLVNGHVGLAGLDVADGKGELTLWAKNLLNNRSIAFASLLTAVADSLAVQYNRARSYGVDFSIQF